MNPSPIWLGPEHSGTTFGPASPGGVAEISGSRLLDGLSWAPAGAGFPAGVFKAKAGAEAAGLGRMDALRLGGQRVTRARHPNGERARPPAAAAPANTCPF